MSGIDLHAAAAYVVAITEIAASKGIALQFGSDFVEFRNLLESQPKRNSLAPMFAPDRSVIASEKGFWIAGLNETGEVVHSQAMRVIDLSAANLAEHLALTYRDFRPGGLNIDPLESAFFATPGPKNISGKICYHGELWLKSGQEGYRGGGLTAVLPRLALAMGLLKWSPDFIFGFMYPLAACKGLAAREGYVHLEPGSVSWRLPGNPEAIEEWLVWMSRADIDYLISLDPHALFDKIEAANAAKAARPDEVRPRVAASRSLAKQRFRARTRGLQRPRRIRQRNPRT